MDKVLNDGEARPDLNLYFMRMARLVATRSTCLRRAVGCVLVDERGHVLSTGYNGVAAGDEHCNQGSIESRDVSDEDELRIEKTNVRYPHACEGAFAKSGTNLNACAAVHAEQNALLQCPDVKEIATAYVTVAPCDSCLKLFLNTGCKVIVVGGWYYLPDGTSNEEAVKERWQRKAVERLVLLDERP